MIFDLEPDLLSTSDYFSRDQYNRQFRPKNPLQQDHQHAIQ